MPSLRRIASHQRCAAAESAGAISPPCSDDDCCRCGSSSRCNCSYTGASRGKGPVSRFRIRFLHRCASRCGSCCPSRDGSWRGWSGEESGRSTSRPGCGRSSRAWEDCRMTDLRIDSRTPDQLRPVTFERGWSKQAEGSCLVSFGDTKVLCTASFTNGVPRWMTGKGKGWVTAEYSMLPRATNSRNDREAVKGKIGGRTHEISRLIGRSLRAVVDMKALGENTIMIDCDVLQADGGTRTAAITGAYVALADALDWGKQNKFIAQKAAPLTDSLAAVSVGIIDGTPMLDL